MLADLGPVLAVSAGRLSYLYSAGRQSARLLWTITMNGECDVPADLGPVLAVSAGDFHSCALRTDGQLVCFGDNDVWAV